MLYLEIQKLKEAMNSLGFQQQIGGTDDCMKRIKKAAKGCGHLSSNDTLFDDSWFSGMKIAEEAMAEGVYYFGHVKKSHKGVFLATFEKSTKECLGQSHLVMNINPRVPGDIPLMYIGHIYRSQKILGFIDTGGGHKYYTRCYLFV